VSLVTPSPAVLEPMAQPLATPRDNGERAQRPEKQDHAPPIVVCLQTTAGQWMGEAWNTPLRTA